jgi:phage-related protein
LIGAKLQKGGTTVNWLQEDLQVADNGGEKMDLSEATPLSPILLTFGSLAFELFGGVWRGKKVGDWPLAAKNLSTDGSGTRATPKISSP